jgi:hypothetical protein
MLNYAVALLVDETGILDRVTCRGIDAIKDNVFLRKRFPTDWTDPLLLLSLLHFQIAPYHRLATLIVAELFPNFPPVGKQKVSIASGESIQSLANLGQQFVRHPQFLV